jgi:hypothetical protein
MQARLAGEHALTIELGGRTLQAQIRMGAIAAARAALNDMPTQQRDRAEMRITAAAVHLAEGDPRAAVDALGPGVEREVRALHPTWAALEASVGEAAARAQLGDRRAAEESIERALELAEPDGMILPFVLAPVRALLERHPRHRTAHATLLTTILDLFATPGPGRQANRRDCSTRSATPNCASSGTCQVTSKRPKSRPSCAFRRTPSGPICPTSTPSSAPTTAARRSPAAASYGYSDPVERDGAITQTV